MSQAITETCTLRCDYYHQMEQRWSNKLGQITMYSIGKYLRCMLLSKTIQEWNEVYDQAVKVLEGNPNSVSILMAIHQNPSYYIGYYLKGIKGSMDVLGYIIADQNQSINVAIIGKGSSMSIIETTFCIVQ